MARGLAHNKHKVTIPTLSNNSSAGTKLLKLDNAQYVPAMASPLLISAMLGWPVKINPHTNILMGKTRFCSFGFDGREIVSLWSHISKIVQNLFQS